MELPQYYFSLVLFFLIPFISLCLLHKLKLTNKYSSIRLPPGRTGFPLIGESLNYFLKIRKGDQFEFVTDRMQKYSSKIFRTSLLGQPMAILCSAEGNKFLFSNDNKLVQIWFPITMDKLFPRPDNHHPAHALSYRLRKVILSPFILQVDSLQERLGTMDALMKQHLEAYWRCKDEAAVIKAVGIAKNYALALGFNVFLGIDDLIQIEQFVEGMDDIESALFGVPINLPGTSCNRGIRASKVLRSKIEAMMREKRTHLSQENASSSTTTKDFIACMVLAVDENGQFFKVEELASYLAGLMEAGYTSLRSTVTMLINTLADLPHVYDSVLKEQKEIANLKDRSDRLSWEDFGKMKYSWNVVREILRLYSPTIGGFKETTTDITFEGYTIPKGWKIHWLLNSTHMNPEYFHDPQKFDPSRFEGDGPIPYTFIPFGGGPRICPGNKYARLAILTFLHYVITEFRWEKVNLHEKLLFEPIPNPAQGLPIRLYRHKD